MNFEGSLRTYQDLVGDAAITVHGCRNIPTIDAGRKAMYMKITAIVLVALLLNITAPSRAFAATSAEQEARFAEKVKTQIAKLGTGPQARVEVKLRDKTKLKGHISEVGDEFFAVVDEKTGSATTLAYSQVKQVKGNNLSTGAAIAIGIGIGIGIVFLLAFIGTKVAE